MTKQKTSAAPVAETQDDAWSAALAAEEGHPGNDVFGGEAAHAESVAGADMRGAARDLAMVRDIPVQLTVELGRTRLTIKELLELAQGSVVELDGLAGEPMDILINGYLVAKGEIVMVDERYGVRILDIMIPAERLQKLSQ